MDASLCAPTRRFWPTSRTKVSPFGCEEDLKHGKPVHFLRLLGHASSENQPEEQETALFNLEQACTDIIANPSISFSETFNETLNIWISSIYHSSSAVLRQQLEIQCGLFRVLEALEHVYLFRNGALSSNIASNIFTKIDIRRKDWSDSFVLTALLRSAFTTTSCVDTDSLTVRTSSSSIRGTSSHQRSMDSLCTMHIIYLLPWPVANIISRSSMETYQSVFILLLQLQQAKQALERRFPRKVA